MDSSVIFSHVARFAYGTRHEVLVGTSGAEHCAAETLRGISICSPGVAEARPNSTEHV